MATAYDYETRIDPAALRAAGCAAAIRYVMPQTTAWPKALRTSESVELLAAGIPVVSNFESTAERMLGGALAGQSDAQTLQNDWAALDAPSGLTGWFSGDWDVQPAQVAACLDYLAAAAERLGSKLLTGCYGGYRLVKAAADAGYPIWQTDAWSGGVWDPRAVMRQTGQQLTIGGVQVDVNSVVNISALGAWTSGGSTMGDVALSGGYTTEWPDLASTLAPKFPPGEVVSVEVDAEWANMGARASALYAKQGRDEITALKAELDTANGKLDQIIAALAATTPGGVNPATVAADVVQDLGTKLTS